MDGNLATSPAGTFENVRIPRLHEHFTQVIGVCRETSWIDRKIGVCSRKLASRLAEETHIWRKTPWEVTVSDPKNRNTQFNLQNKYPWWYSDITKINCTSRDLWEDGFTVCWVQTRGTTFVMLDYTHQWCWMHQDRQYKLLQFAEWYNYTVNTPSLRFSRTVCCCITLLTTMASFWLGICVNNQHSSHLVSFGQSWAVMCPCMYAAAYKCPYYGASWFTVVVRDQHVYPTHMGAVCKKHTG